MSAALTGYGWNIGAALKSMTFGAISGAATFGIGSIFTSSAGSLTAFADSLGTFGTALVKGGMHAISQGTLAFMQGGNFGQAFIAGAMGSLGASAFGAIAKDVANTAVATIAFGAVAGGVGSAMAGGNFWQGALIGGVVAGLNDVMHKINGPGPKNSAWIKKYKELARKQMLAQQKSRQVSTDVLNKKDTAVYSETMTVKSVGGFISNAGDTVTLTGYGLTLTGAGSTIGIPLSGVGNIISGVGSFMEFSDAYLNKDYVQMGKIAGFKVLDVGTGHLASKYKGLEGTGSAILQQNVGLKVWLLEKLFDETYKPVKTK